jgi:hypothetical protein
MIGWQCQSKSGQWMREMVATAVTMLILRVSFESLQRNPNIEVIVPSLHDDFSPMNQLQYYSRILTILSSEMYI